MNNQIDFAISLNNFLNPPKEEREPEPEPESSDNPNRDLYNKEKPKYRKKPLKQIFNNLGKTNK